jgi:hypothetical protein
MTNETEFASFFLKFLENSMQVMWKRRRNPDAAGTLPAMRLDYELQISDWFLKRRQEPTSRVANRQDQTPDVPRRLAGRCSRVVSVACQRLGSMAAEDREAGPNGRPAEHDRCSHPHSGSAAPFSIHSRTFLTKSAWVSGGFVRPSPGSQPPRTSLSSVTW